MTEKIREMINGLYAEAEMAVQDTHRTMCEVKDPAIKDILQNEFSAVNAKVPAIAAGTGIAATAVSTIASSVAGTGLTIAGTGTAASFATVGALGGSAVPVIGTIVGAVVGAGLGLFKGKRRKAKAERKALQEREEIRTALEKQDRYIRQLEKELEQLREEYGQTKIKQERYKYILGIVATHYDMRQAWLTV